MARRRQVPRDPNEPSYGKIMTGMLIPKDSRSNPRRILSGVAFILFVGFFLIAALGRGCRHDAPPAVPENPPAASATSGS